MEESNRIMSITLLTEWRLLKMVEPLFLNKIWIYHKPRIREHSPILYR